MSEVLSVSQVTKIVSSYIDKSNLKNVYIQGEISNVNYHQKGHLYFSLKEKISNSESALIKCVAFYYKQKNMPLDLKEGNNVKVFANVNFYTYSGDLNFIVNSIEKQSDMGLLYQEFEKRKKEYLEKGYFDNKKPLPKLVKRLGVITSATGDAIRDIKKTTHNRDENVDIFLYPVNVQGIYAKSEIAHAIKYFNENNDKYNLDAIIVGRGGGSIEDLWAFNEIEVIEAIYASKIFVVSAVGHETDVLLSDFVADKRASTPTQAAEILISVKSEKINELRNFEKILKKDLNSKYELMKKDLSNLKKYFSKTSFINNINNKRNNLVDRFDNVYKTFFNKFNILKRDLSHKKEIFHRISIKNKLNTEKEKIDNIRDKIMILMKNKLNFEKEYISKCNLKVSKYSSKDILKLGYTMIKQENRIISKSKDFDKKKELEIIFYDKSIRGVIKNEKK